MECIIIEDIQTLMCILPDIIKQLIYQIVVSFHYNMENVNHNIVKPYSLKSKYLIGTEK